MLLSKYFKENKTVDYSKQCAVHHQNSWHVADHMRLSNNAAWFLGFSLILHDSCLISYYFPTLNFASGFVEIDAYSYPG